jgi:hypothetical protein
MVTSDQLLINLYEAQDHFEGRESEQLSLDERAKAQY